ncbi:MAG: glycosyltransferase [Clostridiales Family XIII bacterium]|jgi:glycosyltransferase involved in cell wall biosynthesis|nr:glycosyltransferase [Clostridiales Family XIII bacterium]
MTTNHTFVICAYKESAFLDEAAATLCAQTIPSKILISTSTPNDTIRGVADKYGLEVRVNPAGGSSPRDWNFAYAQAETDFVTLAHQDDYYEPEFAEKTMTALESSKNPIVAFTNYYELRNGVRTESNHILRIKRFMCVPFSVAKGSRFLRNRVFSFGYPVNCPGSTYNKKRFPALDFVTNYNNSHDWEAISRLAQEKGDFLYIKELLMGHRIYAESQTTNMVANGQRYNEDYEMFLRYWPKPIAKMLIKRYSKAYDSNKL